MLQKKLKIPMHASNNMPSGMTRPMMTPGSGAKGSELSLTQLRSSGSYQQGTDFPFVNSKSFTNAVAFSCREK